MARRQTTKLIELKNRAKREGWLKHLRRGLGEEADEQALMAGCRFDLRRANHVVEFFARFGSLTEGAFAGQPFDLLDWQRDWLMTAFGWVKPSPEWGCDVRRFRYVYLEVPKKNGKTPLAATLGNYLLFGDSHGRQINMHVAATTRKQAERLLVHSIRQVRANPALDAAGSIRKLEGFYQLGYGESLWSVLAADPESADGINGHVIADELHRWSGFEFFNTLRWALASQPEGMFVGITTAGSEMQSVCRTLHEKTLAVNDGRQFDEAFFGLIYAADPDDDPHDEKVWHRANPSLGTTRKHPLKLSTFRADYEAAKADPSQWPAWLQLRLNLWRTGVESWMDELGGIARWDAGEAARRTAKAKRIDCFEPFTVESLLGKPCWLGFDGATHHDTTAAVFVFADEKEDELLRVLPFYWLCRAEAEKQQARVPYRHWSEAGHLTITEGDAVDFDRVFRDLVELCRMFSVQRMYFDPLFQAEWLTARIAEAVGIDRAEFPQTIVHFAPAVNAAARLIVLKQLRHNGHPLLTWQLGHCQMKADSNNNRRPIKRQRNDYRTIDGVVAMLMAMNDAIAGDGVVEGFYESNDIEFI